MSEYVIRRMTVEDVDQVTAIEAATFARPWDRASFLHEVTENAVARYLVCCEGDNVIGYAGAWIILDESHITNIAVREDKRDRGIGKELTRALLQYLSNLGASCATLEVRVSNERAQAVYRDNGFVKVGKRKKYYEDNGEDAWLMVCDHLPPADPEFSEAETAYEE